MMRAFLAKRNLATKLVGFRKSGKSSLCDSETVEQPQLDEVIEEEPTPVEAEPEPEEEEQPTPVETEETLEEQEQQEDGYLAEEEGEE